MQVRNPLHIAQRYIGVPLKGGKIREVGDSRKADHRNVQELPLRGSGKPLGETVLIVNVHMGIGDDTHHRNAAELFQDLNARFQNRAVSPEFVHDGSLDSRTFVLFQQGHGSIQLGKDTAPVNITHQQHRGIHQPGKTHVHNVFLLQVDLRRASGTFDDDDVIFGGQTVVGLQDGRDIRLLFAVILHGPHIALNLPGNDHLAAHIGGWFEQYGVHPHIRVDSRRFRLHHLSPAHLAAVFGDEGIQGHVLALEGGNPVSVLLENAAESGTQQALSRIGHGALNHNVFCHVHTSFIASIRRLFSSCSRTAMRYHPTPRP